MPSRYLQSADLRSRRLTQWYFQPQSHGWAVCCQLLGKWSWNMENLEMYYPCITKNYKTYKTFKVISCLKMHYPDEICWQHFFPKQNVNKTWNHVNDVCFGLLGPHCNTPLCDLHQGCWRTWRAIAHWPFLDQLWCHVGCALEVVRFGVIFFGVCIIGQVVFPARSILFHLTLSVFVMNAASWWYCKWWSAVSNTLN